MIFPIDVHIGSLSIPSHSIFELLAFFIGYRYYIYLKKKGLHTPLSAYIESFIIIGMTMGAFIGSRFVAALENPMLFLHSPTWFYYIGGQTIAGGVIGGILGVELTKKILGVKRKTGDLFVYPLILSIIIGRIGCFLKGVSDGTVGLPCDFIWCFSQGDTIPRHPTSLYEIGVLILIWIILKQVEKKKILKEGDLFSTFILIYATFRFLVEFIKPIHPLFVGLSSIQLLTGVTVIYFIIYFIKKYKYNL